MNNFSKITDEKLRRWAREWLDAGRVDHPLPAITLDSAGQYVSLAGALWEQRRSTVPADTGLSLACAAQASTTGELAMGILHRAGLRTPEAVAAAIEADRAEIARRIAATKVQS